MRTGKDYLNSLQDNRLVFMDGERVKDVVAHPAFKGITKAMASIYDFAYDRRNNMSYETPDGTWANKIWMIPRSREDMVEGRAAIRKWAERTYGFAGRTPDHVAGFLAGFASRPDVFEQEGGHPESVTGFYKYARDNDLFVSYVIIPPQSSKAAQASGQDGTSVSVTEERDDGIVLKGAQILGTGSAVSDYIHVSYVAPLPPGNEHRAISLVVPVGAQGLRIYPRPSFAAGKPSVYDYPLSTRFDETDALVVFDDVFIPWEHVFVYGDTGLVQRHFHETPAHMYGNRQAQIRFVTKLQFMLGLARKIVEKNGSDKIPGVQEKLGELASITASMEALMLASEYQCTIDHDVAYPYRRTLYGLVGLQDVTYSKVVHTIRDLAGSGALQQPSSYHELVENMPAHDMYTYMGASTDSSTDRIKLFKLVWDAIGSEFAGRSEQYEMFYNGAPFVTKGYAYRNYDFSEAVALVDDCLSSYTLPNV